MIQHGFGDRPSIIRIPIGTILRFVQAFSSTLEFPWADFSAVAGAEDGADGAVGVGTPHGGAALSS
jgi:hypothetical protein